MVPDHGDRCLFIFLWSSCLFCNIFPFPVCKAKLIGDCYENRRGAPNTSIFLIFRHAYWRTDVPCANRGGGPNTKKKLLEHCVWSALPIGAGDIGAPVYWRTEHKKFREMLGFWVGKQGNQWKFWRIFHAIWKELEEADRTVRCASPIFKPIAY